LFSPFQLFREVNSHERIITAANYPELVGLRFSEVVNRVNWTSQRKAELEREQLYGLHTSACPNLNVFAQMAVQVILSQRSGGEAPGPNPSNALSGLQTISTPGANSTASYPPQTVAYRPPPPSCQRLRSPWERQPQFRQRNQVDLFSGRGRYPHVPAPISGGFFNRPRLGKPLVLYPSTYHRTRQG